MGAFDGIITSEMKTMFTDAIDALLEDTACMVPCTIFYGETNWTDCPNCFYDAVGRKSTNKYTSGGPIEFHSGICPYCHGRGRLESESTDTIYLMPIWDYESWVGWNGSSAHTRYPNGAVQTMSKISTITQIKKAKEIIINTDIQQYTHHRMTRSGEPTPCGFGNDSYILTIWEHMV